MHRYIVFFELAAVVSAWVAWPVIRRHTYLRYLCLLLTLIGALELYQALTREYVAAEVNVHIYNLSEPVFWYLYVAMFWQVLETPSFRRYLKWGALLYGITFAVSTPLYWDGGAFNVISYTVSSVILIALTLTKFYELVQIETGTSFLREPLFYIIFALLLFNLGTLPYFTMANWLYYDLNRPNTAMVLANVMALFNFLLYGTYTIVFVWLRFFPSGQDK